MFIQMYANAYSSIMIRVVSLSVRPLCIRDNPDVRECISIYLCRVGRVSRGRGTYFETRPVNPRGLPPNQPVVATSIPPPPSTPPPAHIVRAHAAASDHDDPVLLTTAKATGGYPKTVPQSPWTIPRPSQGSGFATPVQPTSKSGKSASIAPPDQPTCIAPPGQPTSLGPPGQPPLTGVRER